MQPGLILAYFQAFHLYVLICSHSTLKIFVRIHYKIRDFKLRNGIFCYSEKEVDTITQLLRKLASSTQVHMANSELRQGRPKV